MYQTSTSKRFWTFQNEQELMERRVKSNQDFINAHGAHLDVSFIQNLSFRFQIPRLFAVEAEAIILLEPLRRESAYTAV
jgi:hypothetical protein